MSERMTVTEKKDSISALVQALEKEDGILVRAMLFEWNRQRTEDGSRRAVLIGMDVEADLL